MKPLQWTMGIFVLLLAAAALPAQYGPPGLSINYLKVRRNAAFSFSLNRGYGIYNPYCGPFGPCGPGFARSSFTQIVVQQPPVFIPVPYALLPEEAPVAFAPLAGRLIPPQRDDDFLPAPPPPPPAEELPGRDAGIFKPLDPDNRDRARRPVAPAPPDKPVPPPVPPAPRRPAAPDHDPRIEGPRRIDSGKEAFERGEYGRAMERFRQAAGLTPNNALPYLLLGQAHIALGNHRRAFDAIQTGLRIDPDWPNQPFRPIELYGDNVNDHADHTQILEDLLAATPDDPVMLFLAGYQLWFDGRRDEAKILLQRAAPSLPDPSLVDRFLQALPPADII